MNRFTICTFLFMLIFASCKKGKEKDVKTFEFNFTQDTQGWESFFSEYPPGSESFYELEFSHSNLPVPLDANTRAIKVSGNNHSDDLLSLITRKIENLKPNTRYSVTFEVELASNVTTNSPGAGGSPDLAFGVGAVSANPENVINSGHYRPNFTSLLQSGQSNDILMSIGRIGVSDVHPAPFTLINRNNLSEPMQLRTNDKGEIWFMMGTDSGFEGITTLYYKSIKIRME